MTHPNDGRSGDPGQPQQPAGHEREDAENPEVPPVDNTPSTEEEIKPGINQDIPSSEQFSSEPATEAGSPEGD